MSILETQIAKTLGAGMAVPRPLAQLFDWIEANGLFYDDEPNRRGCLFSEAEIGRGWTETGFEPSTAKGDAGALFLAWVATKLTQPLRIAATLGLTPLVASVVRRLRAKSP